MSWPRCARRLNRFVSRQTRAAKRQQRCTAQPTRLPEKGHRVPVAPNRVGRWMKRFIAEQKRCTQKGSASAPRPDARTKMGTRFTGKQERFGSQPKRACPEGETALQRWRFSTQLRFLATAPAGPVKRGDGDDAQPCVRAPAPATLRITTTAWRTRQFPNDRFRPLRLADAPFAGKPVRPRSRLENRFRTVHPWCFWTTA